MKLKYYIRGIGIGIIITTFVFLIANIAGVFSTNKGVVAENETKATSSVLAYATTSQAEGEEKQATTIATVETTESESTSDEDEGETTKEAQQQDNTEVSEENNNDTNSETSRETEATKEQTTQETTSRNNQARANDGEVIEVDIKNIKYVSEVSEILYNKGIISDVAEFNSYMTFSGNDLKVQEGRYKLKAGDTFENIASVITRSE